MKVTLEEIKDLVEKLAEKIAAPKYLLPTYGNSKDGGHPHIEIDQNGQLYYIVVERGQERKKDYAADTHDLLYRIFADVTFNIASNFEVNNRREKEDTRRQLFSKQEELIGLLYDDWKKRLEKDHFWILRFRPFDDLAGERVDYCKELRNKGMESWKAWDESNKKYPLPKRD